MSYLVESAVITAVCIISGKWKKWREYYPTILYVIIGNLVCELFFYHHPLWAFGSISYDMPVIDIIVMVLLFPATVILFLAYYPKIIYQQILYILLWVAIFILKEVIACLSGGFMYLNGWTLYYSLLFDLTMFPLIRLHYKKPLAVWPVSAALAFLMIWWFRLPLYH